MAKRERVAPKKRNIDWHSIKKSAAKCPVCHKSTATGVRLWKCYECNKKFCSDHIWAGQCNLKMKDTEEVRDVCSKCQEIKKYFDVKYYYEKAISSVQQRK